MILEYLHDLKDFTRQEYYASEVQYFYKGTCLNTGKQLQLRRTIFAELVAKGLMKQIKGNAQFEQEGKMYGILIVKTPNGSLKVIKAFSGLLQGESVVPKWVPGISGRSKIALAEKHTLIELGSIKDKLITLENQKPLSEYEAYIESYNLEKEILFRELKFKKNERNRMRNNIRKSFTGEDLQIELLKLDEQSKRDGIQKKNFKKVWNAKLIPLKDQIASIESEMLKLKKLRKQLSKNLQEQMHAAYSLTNFTGNTVSLNEIYSSGLIPTGTGECCAPKLLHFAAEHSLLPLEMAEFWWGDSGENGKLPGEFYGACKDRCEPIMGFLLSGLEHRHKTGFDYTVIYEDEHILAVDKDSGILSVPGRGSENYDSIEARLCKNRKAVIKAIHRLDRETSGIVLYAKTKVAHTTFSELFAERNVYKKYEAIIDGIINIDEGEICVPIYGDHTKRPLQEINFEKGKNSKTFYKLIEIFEGKSRIEFQPVTGRTHQLRIHSAAQEGLGCPIIGDKLYGNSCDTMRLHLHAKEISFYHPFLKKEIIIQSKVPF